MNPLTPHTLTRYPALLLSFLCTLGLGCSGADDAASPTPSSLDGCTSPCQALTTTGGHYFLEVVPDPAPPIAGDGVFSILVMQEGEVAVTGAAVTVEGLMDMGGGMSHGFPEEAVVTEVGDGRYSASVVYSMSGEWTVLFGVASNGISEVAELSLMVE